jgi:hypothetical protein
MQDAVSYVRQRWIENLTSSLRDCGWPPTATASTDAAATPWLGFVDAPEATLTATQAAFASLLDLQIALDSLRTAHPEPAGPWAAPQLWAVEGLVRPQLEVLQNAFFGNGAFSSVGSTEWVFQATTVAMEVAREAMEGFQATIDAAEGVAEGEYAIGREVVRSMHSGICNLVVAQRLPEIAAAGGEQGQSQWLSLADAAVSWERTVRSSTSIVAFLVAYVGLAHYTDGT